MAIKALTIRNLQSHKKTTLNLHPGVNVIVGASDCGKSAILRAAGWVIKNKIEDKGFRSKWGGKSDVELIFNDGIEVSRVQDKDNAYYLVDSANNVDEEYKAFRSDIPEAIVQALNLDPLNIQSQFDPPFLLADSPGDVAKTLNKIANLTQIDSTISNIRKRILANSREITSIENQIVDFEIQKESFKYIKQMEKDVEIWEALNEKSQLIETEDERLAELLVVIFKDQVELEDLDLFLKAEEGLKATLTLTEEERRATGQIKWVETLLVKIQKDTEAAEEIENFLKAELEVIKALELVEELKEIQKEGQALQNIIQTYLTTESKLQTLTKELDCMDIEWASLMPIQCPLCGK